MEALAPFRETKQAKAALAKIMGDKVVPIRVKRSIKEYQPPRATPLDPADPQESNPLKSFNKAGLDLAALVVEGVEAFAGLSPGQPVARGDLATRAKRLNEHLEQRFSWRTQSGFESNDVSMMNLLRVSQKKTLTEPHRRGFASQLDLFVQIKRRDGDNWLRGGMYIARDLSRFADGAVEHAWALLNPERLDDDDAVPSLDGELKTTPLSPRPARRSNTGPRKTPRTATWWCSRGVRQPALLEMLAELRKNKAVGVDALTATAGADARACLAARARSRRRSTCARARVRGPAVVLPRRSRHVGPEHPAPSGHARGGEEEDRSFNDETKNGICRIHATARER